MSDEHQFREAHYRIAMEAAGLGMWYWDLVQNRQEWNKECKAILGVSENTQGSYEYFLSLIYPEDYERVQALLAESHRARTPYVTEYRIIWPDGSLHWIADRGKYLYNAQGNAVRLVGVIWDITVQKIAEEARAELERKKDEFISLASHELRTPLTSLKGNLQLAQRRLRRCLDEDSLPAKEEKVLFEHLVLWNERALRQVNIGSRLVNDLLDANCIRAESLRILPEESDLVQIVRQAVDDKQTLALAHPLHLEAPAMEEISVRADAARIEQVVANYIKNALQFSDEQQPVIVGIKLEKAEVRVWVKDRGPGLSPEAQRLLWGRFRPFSDRTGYAGSGSSGLGLSLYICESGCSTYRAGSGKLHQECSPIF